MIAAYFVIGASVFFKDYRAFGVWLVTVCIPLGIQYRLQKGGLQNVFVTHFGGAPDVPLVNLVDFPILALIGLWIFDLILSRRKIPKWTRFDTSIVAFFSLSLLSLYNTHEYALFAYEVARYIKYYLLYWVLRTYIQESIHYWGIFAVALFALGINGIVAMAQYFFFFQLPVVVGGVREAHFDMVGGEVLQRVTGVLGHCNTFAAYLVASLSSALILFSSRIRRRWKVLIIPVFLFGCIAIVMTYSRNGWLSLVVCTVIILGLAIRTGRVSRLAVTSILISAIFVIGMIFGFGLDNEIGFLDRNQSQGSIIGLSRNAFIRVFEDDKKALEGRWDLILVSTEMIKEHPIIGIGLNSFEENMASYDRIGITNVIQQPVHNAFVLVAAETGIPSMIAFLAAGIAILRRSLALARGKEELDYVLGAFGFCTFIGLGFSNLFDATIRKEPILGMMVLVAAMVMARSVPGSSGDQALGSGQ